MNLDEYWRRLQQAIHDNRLCYYPLNDKTIRFMSQYNLDSEDVMRLVKTLEKMDCFDGPEDERFPEVPFGQVCEFKKRFIYEESIADIDVYIKLKVFESNGGYGCFIWAFHKNKDY